jgi:hypothetical protein
MKDLELLHVMAEIRHVFGGESFLWRTEDGVSDMRGARRGRLRRNSRSRTDTISSVSIGGLWASFAFSSMISMPSACGLDKTSRRVIRTTEANLDHD